MPVAAMFFFLAICVGVITAQDGCVQLDGFIRQDFKTQVSKEYFNCTVTLPCAGLNMTSVTFVEILRSNKRETRSLASINVKKVVTTDDQDVKGMSVGGVLNRDRVSYLSLSFMSENTINGSVKTDCIVRGFDSLGNSVVRFGSLSSKSVKCKDNSELLKTKCRSLFSYSQSKYCISSFLVKNISAAVSNCDLIGGYLAEINDRNEFLTIQSEFNKAGIDIMLIGGTDEAVEGTWVYQYSRSPVTFFDWNMTQPDNRGNNEDCLEIRRYRFSRMNDIRCFNSVHGDSNFLCEINDD